MREVEAGVVGADGRVYRVALTGNGTPVVGATQPKPDPGPSPDPKPGPQPDPQPPPPPPPGFEHPPKDPHPNNPPGGGKPK